MTQVADTAEPRVPRAVLYLRVSTPSQVNTDYDPEGISIPAQRLACERKASLLGVEIVGEYVEPGRTGTSIEKRPVFQEMLKRIREERDVDHVIVYKLSRLNRNRIDDAKVLMLMRRYKVTLISATENIDDTPVGQLMHGILAAFNEFRSAEDGADIRYKMGQKAKNGGTLGKATLGYLNVRDRFEGREVRAVALDEERAPLVRKAFQLYATGDYTLAGLQRAMADQGLMTRPTAARPSLPVSVNKLHQMLGDPYYAGRIVYQGEEYAGRHPALVTPELFERVQEVLQARSSRGLRQRVHDHYLKGLFCGRCHAAGREHRLIYMRVRGRAGEHYEYFACRGRQERECDLPHLAVHRVEEAVIREYAHLGLPDGFRASVLEQLAALMADEQQATEEMRRNVGRELTRLEVQEERLIDLAADGTLPTAKIRTRLTRLHQDKQRIRERLARVDEELAAGAELVQVSLHLLEHPQELYRQASAGMRRQLNQVFYERLYVEDEMVSDRVLNWPFTDLHEASARYQRVMPQEIIRVNTKKRPSGGALQETNAVLLATVFSAGGSSKTALVGKL